IHELKYLFITCSLPFTVVPIYFQRIIEKGRNKFLPLKSKYYLYSNFKTSSTGYLTDLSSSTFLFGFPRAIPIIGTYCSVSSPITLAAFLPHNQRSEEHTSELQLRFDLICPS